MTTDVIEGGLPAMAEDETPGEYIDRISSDTEEATAGTEPTGEAEAPTGADVTFDLGDLGVLTKTEFIELQEAAKNAREIEAASTKKFMEAAETRKEVEPWLQINEVWKQGPEGQKMVIDWFKSQSVGEEAEAGIDPDLLTDTERTCASSFPKSGPSAR
jgi:hypothetical protein